MKKCSICNKNVAMMYQTRFENGQAKMEGICMSCAKKMGIPIVDEIMKQVNLSPEDMDNLSKQMQQFMEDQDPDELENNPLFNMLGSSYDEFSNDNEDEESEDEQDDDSIHHGHESPPIHRFKTLSFGGEKDDDTSSTHATVNDANRVKEDKRRKKRKNLDKFGENLNDKATSGLIDRIIGRDKEIERVMHILNRRSKNNPILVGEPGVGKTAIAEGLAIKIVNGEVPEKLLDAEIYLLDLTAIVAGTQFRGQFEGRMQAIIKEAKETGNIILVIDEVHNIMGAGEVHGGVMNAANILKPALAKGEVQVIGATTMEEYRKHIEKDAALERRFQPVVVDEPTVEESIEILKGIKGYYETYHKVDIDDEVVIQAVILSKRYVSDRFLPDKAIDVIDEAGAMVNLKNSDMTALKALQKRLQEVVELKEEASIHDHFEDAAKYKIEEIKLIDQISTLKNAAEHHHVTVEDVAYVIESWTKIPVTRIKEEEAKKLIHLEERLHQRVIGQNEAVSALAKSIRRSRAGFKRRLKPASFIFVGPTGVGKTELAKTLAVELFGSEEAMIRLDMSEYMEKHTVSKLIGAPPGYVGYDQGGQLTERIRRRPYSVILLDEIEKAHPDVFNMLLQILEDGRLTDNQGRTVFFENAVLIMTSNAGTQLKSAGIGFEPKGHSQMASRVMEALKEFFRPEFINRVDDIVVFDQLKREEVRLIVDLQLLEVLRDAKEKSIHLHVENSVKDYLALEGYDTQYGARPLRRLIQRLIEDEVADRYLKGELTEGSNLLITLDPVLKQLVFRVEQY
jgi:ATP-dependent Clp protease ATP-binding subunit ClpC